MSATDDLLRNNAAYAEGFDKGDLPAPPAKRVAVLACMDARLDVHKILGLEEGDAHVIRNAGGIVTDDAIRSLAISQRLLGTREVIVLQHTGCGMLTFSDEDFAKRLRDEAGSEPEWRAGTFSDLDDNVRESIRRLKENAYLPATEQVRGFVYEVETGRLREVEAG